jgi:hypothetical protein
VPRIERECEFRSRGEFRDRSQYLEKVRNIRMDLVDDFNAIAEDGCSLAGMQSGLDDRWNAHVSILLQWHWGWGSSEESIIPAMPGIPVARAPF